MKKLNTYCFILTLLASSLLPQLSYAKLNNQSMIVSFSKYILNNRATLKKNNISDTILVKQQNKTKKYTAKNLKCFAEGKCKISEKAITSISILTENKKINSSLKAYSVQLSNFYSLPINIETLPASSNGLIIYLLALLFIGIFGLKFILKSKKLNFKVKRPKLLTKLLRLKPNKNKSKSLVNDDNDLIELDQRQKSIIKNLQIDNKSLEKDLEGLYYLWYTAREEFEGLQNTVIMNKKLPKSLSHKINNYEQSEVRLKAKYSKYISKSL